MQKKKTRVSLPSAPKKVVSLLFHPITRWVVEASIFLALMTIIFLGTARNIPFLKDQHFFVVLSGSMEPEIRTGSLVLVTENAGEPQVDEVWTFVTPRTRQIITHRILNKRVDDGALVFSTKGDANDTPDPWILKKPSFFGKVKFSVPFAGYIVDFARTPKGFFFVAVVPGLVIIIDEVFKIKKIMQLKHEKELLTLKKELEDVKTKQKKKKK